MIVSEKMFFVEKASEFRDNDFLKLAWASFQMHYHSVVLGNVQITLYPWMSPFWASRGGGSHVTSSCVAVEDWTITFCGGAVGTAERVNRYISNVTTVRVLRKRKPRTSSTSTCFSNKHLLRGAARTLPDSVVHTESDLVAFVFAQIWKEGSTTSFMMEQIK